ncbi:MAG: sigma-70 family RNA polymerase sigma factor [Eubacteriales bacterium]|nr:sigma-70 family RNA polymerase sigma factor [Clostridiales bacterium]MDD7302105.1 sigma-70 family RNA polymerase sigma factor [Eubacteriales bacterium]MDY4435337.1 sigma-70 family RNA polymerase sigma factor [Candidatus Flemingibacterium sp.]
MDELFETFMRNNYRRFYAFCVSRRAGHGDADDIVSEAFMRLYKKWPEIFRYTDEYLIKWMYKAITLIINEYRRNDQKHDTVNLDDYADILTVGNDADKAFRYSDLIESLEKDMTPSDKELFRLVFLVGLQRQELCERFGINDQALRTRISKLKERMKRTILKKIYPTCNNNRFFYI